MLEKDYQSESTFTTLWAISADDKLVFFLFQRKQNLKLRDTFHELSNPIFWESKKTYFKMSSAENFIKSAKHLKLD